MQTVRYDDRRDGNTYEASFNDSSEFIEGRCFIDGRISLNDSIKYARLEEIPEPARTELRKKAGLSN
jgi:hypothetical protein